MKRTVAAIGAHPDDLELGCFGSLRMFMDMGYHVSLVLMSAGKYYDHYGRVYRENGAEEAKRGAEILGTDDLTILDFTDNEIPYSRTSVMALNKILDEKEATIILTHWMGDNQPDHQNAARATITAARKYPNILMYEGPIGRPWISAETFRPIVYIDISEYLELKLRAIEAHRSQIERFGKEWVEAHKVRAQLRGYEIGCRSAEAFEPVKLELGTLAKGKPVPRRRF